jgi:hypothetical protein
MVLRGRNEESGQSQIFTALVSCDDEKPFRPGCPRLLATLRLAGDDVTDYLSIGVTSTCGSGTSSGTASSPAGSSSDR